MKYKDYIAQKIRHLGSRFLLPIPDSNERPTTFLAVRAHISISGHTIVTLTDGLESTEIPISVLEIITLIDDTPRRWSSADYYAIIDKAAYFFGQHVTLPAAANGERWLVGDVQITVDGGVMFILSRNGETMSAYAEEIELV